MTIDNRDIGGEEHHRARDPFRLAEPVDRFSTPVAIY